MKKLIFILCALLLAAPAIGQTLYSTDAGSDAPVRLYPVNRDEALIEKGVALGPQPLTLTFWLENETGNFVKDVSIIAYAFSEEGLPRGFHAYLIQEAIPPHSRMYFHYLTSDLKVHAGDRVIPLVEEARSGEEVWQLEDRWSGEAILADTYFPDPVSQIFQKGVGADATCEAKCAARQEKCDISCSRCEGQSFGCTCGNDGTIDSTCTCSGCRIAK